MLKLIEFVALNEWNMFFYLFRFYLFVRFCWFSYTTMAENLFNCYSFRRSACNFDYSCELNYETGT